MTKALRRCLRQMAGKVSDYADYCSHLEREASQQVRQHVVAEQDIRVHLFTCAVLQLEHLEGSRQVLEREFEEELAQARQQVNVVSADHAKQRVQLVADSEHFKYEVRPSRPCRCTAGPSAKHPSWLMATHLRCS
jgi:hypothetical protein